MRYLKYLKLSEYLKENNNAYSFRPYKDSDKEQVMDIMKQAFRHVMDVNEIPDYVDSVTNYDISFVATLNSDTSIIAGIYLLGDKNLKDVLEFEEAEPVGDISAYENSYGCEGIALAVREEYKKTGLGTLMKNYCINYISDLGYEYICGVIYKSLNNLEHWAKRRTLVGENDDVYVMASMI